MQKIIVVIGLVALCSGVAFVGGFWLGSSRMGRIKDHALAEYRGQLDRLGRDLEDARRVGESVREGIGIAQDAIADSTRGLEDSLSGIGRLGTVTLQIRGLATAIRKHVEVIRAANTALETVGNRLDGFVDPVVPDAPAVE
jgi:hypothetical protein